MTKMSLIKNNLKFTTELAKWFKRLVLAIIFLYIFETLMITADVRQKAMFIMTDKNSSIKEFMRYYLPMTKTGNTSKSMKVLEQYLEPKYSISENQTLKKSKERLFVNLSKVNLSTVEHLLAKTVVLGGRYIQTKSEQKIALIIPYRDREEHLNIFLRHMHPYLQRQELNYMIFVIEMDKGITFNRAILMNIGSVEAMKIHNFTCFVFHDVDLLPENDKIPYACADMPKHLSVAVDTLKYRLPYKTIFGGVSSIKTEDFKKVNGMSNMFFGWGGEDDDFSLRIRLHNLTIVRPSINIARYKMISHKKDSNKNNKRFCLLKSTKQRMKTDGLSNLKYIVKEIKVEPLFTSILVRVDEQELISLNKNLAHIYNDCKKKSKN